jgi:hypothetical protein
MVQGTDRHDGLKAPKGGGGPREHGTLRGWGCSVFSRYTAKANAYLPFGNLI